MKIIDERIQSLDLSLFSGIESATSGDDRRSLLLVQESVRSHQPYVYLEIGSHMGGTIQPHFADRKCRHIYSIDKRPTFQPDERGRLFFYNHNSTQKMLSNLVRSFPDVTLEKITTFDNDASELEMAAIAWPPQLCFIDGEHTNRAVVADFEFCFRVCDPDAVIALHDSCYIFEGINKIKDDLTRKAIRFQGLKLGGSIYVILLNQAIERHSDRLAVLEMDESDYFERSSVELYKTRGTARWHTWLSGFPRVYTALRAVKHAFVPDVKGRLR
ncbi:MAG: class I SAM-dependent methyltransferase [Chromatiaceae bacterium]